MKCAIMQPTYLPWPGYFNLIWRADVFVFLDDAQFQKNSWHNRNRVVNNGLRQWITVPVKHNRLIQKINETSFVDGRFRLKHTKTIQQIYSNHRFFDGVMEVVEELQSDNSTNLADLNIKLITLIARSLVITTPTLRSSQLNISGRRSDRLAKIMNSVGASEYISPAGARPYLLEDGFDDLTEFKLTFQDFNARAYPQRKCESFINHLSVIDLIANMGAKASLEYIMET